MFDTIPEPTSDDTLKKDVVDIFRRVITDFAFRIHMHPSIFEKAVCGYTLMEERLKEDFYPIWHICFPYPSKDAKSLPLGRQEPVGCCKLEFTISG